MIDLYTEKALLLYGETMIKPRIFLVLICLTLSVFSLLQTISAYEDRISVIEQKNITFELTSEQDYNISTNATMAISMQEISINSTKGDDKNASIVIMSMSLDAQGGQGINQSEFSSFMENIFMGAIRLGNGRELESVVVKSAMGQNVTLHRIVMQSNINKPATEALTAFWDLDEFNHVILSSEIGMNATKEIVETLKLAP